MQITDRFEKNTDPTGEKSVRQVTDFESDPQAFVTANTVKGEDNARIALYAYDSFYAEILKKMEENSEKSFFEWINNDRTYKNIQSLLLCKLHEDQKLSNFIDLIPAVKIQPETKLFLNGIAFCLNKEIEMGIEWKTPILLNEINSLFKKRFDIEWSELSDDRLMLEVYRQMSFLPDCFVLNNTSFDKISVFEKTGKDEMLAYYEPGFFTQKIYFPKEHDLEDFVKKLAAVHEIGHAVDDLYDGKKWYLTDDLWKRYQNLHEMIKDMEGNTEETKKQGWGNLTEEQIEIITKYYQDGSTREEILDIESNNSPIWHSLDFIDPLNVEKSENDNFWKYSRSIKEINKRYFTKGYGDLFSFTQKIRKSSMISLYSMHGPNDWFAEQLVYYFKDYNASTKMIDIEDNNRITPLHGKSVSLWVKEYFDKLITDNTKSEK